MMKMFIKFVFYHTADMCKVFLLAAGLTFLMSSCETEYIPDVPDDGYLTVSGKEGNFSLDIRMAAYGDTDTLPDTRSMEPETDVIRVKDDLFIYATLAVDPVDRTPAVKTRKFETGAKIRVVAYRENPGPVLTYVYDTVYYVNNGTLVRDGSTNKINLPAARYKLVAYSYNDPAAAPPAYADPIQNINPENDLIWGESDTVMVVDGIINKIPITMNHKLSQVKLVATTGDDGIPSIFAFSGVKLPGYLFDLTTETGALTPKTALDQDFTFTIPSGGADTVKSNTRTVYTGTPGDIPTVVHIGSMTVQVTTLKDTTITDFSATFAKSLKSGYSYTMTMNIGNSPDLTDHIPEGFIPYVGAFWRHDQTGERLIRLPRMPAGTIDGIWTAQVIAGRDWIVLDKEPSSDPNIWTDYAALGNNTGFDAAHKLSTTSTFVAGMVRASGSAGFQPGDDQIYFRIGANSEYTPTPDKPVRYGMVLLTYGNNNYRNRIWIRQGEDPDYLMRKTDASAGGYVSGNRPAAVQFSPFNSMATNMGRVPDDAIINNDPNLHGYSYNPAKFTEYPTQAGALIKWVTGFSAYPPLGYPGQMYNSLYNGNPISYPDCPTGYRRPNDGPIGGYPNTAGSSMTTAANMALSEMRQSLWLNPQTGSGTSNTANSTWGYYADGLFDRKAIAGSPNGAANSAVSAATNDIAYIGRIFFNPNAGSNASLFFPAAGTLSNKDVEYGGTTADVKETGSAGYYWTRSNSAKPSPGNSGWYPFGWCLAFNSSSAYPYDPYMSTPTTLRCVLAENLAGILAPPGVLGIGSSSGKLTLRGSKEYKNTSVATGADGVSTLDFGPIENETVYAAHFKWGSLIAISAQTLPADLFDVTDIAWAPAGYNLTGLQASIGAQTGQTAWDMVPYADGTAFPASFPLNTPENIAAGLGDPCQLADGGNMNWKIPDGHPWNGYSAANFSSSIIFNASGINVHGRTAGSPTPAWSMFLPYVGNRNDHGDLNALVGRNGNYWSTAYSSPDGTFNLYFDDQNVILLNSGDRRTSGFAIRCVYDPPLIHPIAGDFAPPGILGVGTNTGKLTLRGSKEYKGTSVATNPPNATLDFGPMEDESVYVVYFKWGSMIGTSAGTGADGDVFNVTDLTWAPPQYNASVLAGQIDWRTGVNAWSLVPFADETAFPTSFPPQNPTAGLGDPCPYADKGASSNTWVMPTLPWNGAGNPTVTNGQIQVNASGTNIWGTMYTGDWSKFYPAAGNRSATDGMLNNLVSSPKGFFWTNDYNGTGTVSIGGFTTSGPAGLGTASSYVFLIGSPGSTLYNTGSSRAMGYAIRCEKQLY